MNFIRLLGPASGRGPSTKSDGRQQSGNAPGTFMDVPENSNDLNILSANGWTKLGYVGTTAQRPIGLASGTPYIDTTLSKAVFFDGNVWRDPMSGSSV